MSSFTSPDLQIRFKGSLTLDANVSHSVMLLTLRKTRICALLHLLLKAVNREIFKLCCEFLLKDSWALVTVLGCSQLSFSQMVQRDSTSQHSVSHVRWVPR